jgi:FkbM family methyltransferase
MARFQRRFTTAPQGIRIGGIQILCAVACLVLLIVSTSIWDEPDYSARNEVASLRSKISELETKMAKLETVHDTNDASQNPASSQIMQVETKTSKHDLDDETKALCHRAHEFESMLTLQEQIKFIADGGGFLSQMYQDATIFSILGKNILNGGGVYVDVAAAHPRAISNTFILDQCYGWRGVCIEADPLRAKLLKEQRSCNVIDTCVSEVEGEEVEFFTVDKLDGTMSNGIAGIGGKTTGSRKMKCKRMSNILQESLLTKVDFMSLDVESAEPLVLAGIDWARVTIELIVIEVDKHVTNTEGGAIKESALRMIEVLEAQNYMPVLELFPMKGAMPISDCTTVLLGQSVQSVFQPNRIDNFNLGVWRRQDVLFVKKGGLYEDLVVSWVHDKAKCGLH